MMKPALSRTLKWTGIGLAVPVALLGAALGALQVPAVKAFVAAKVSEAVSGPDFTLKLHDLAGGLPFGPRLGRVEIGDASGRWLVLEQASVALDPWALFSGRIHVEAVEATRLTVDRMPEGGADTPPSDEPLDLSIPQLPRGLAVDRLSVAEIVLAAPVAGEETRLALTGRFGVDGEGVAGLWLALAPLAGAHAPRLDLEALHRPADDRLTLNLALDEPGGGRCPVWPGWTGRRPSMSP
ncbi:MAG: hypothetical protein PHS60_06090 [Zavarzinia sp.]|nr:hypothetical protein [Zavarzinia sp.]